MSIGSRGATSVSWNGDRRVSGEAAQSRGRRNEVWRRRGQLRSRRCERQSQDRVRDIREFPHKGKLLVWLIRRKCAELLAGMLLSGF